MSADRRDSRRAGDEPPPPARPGPPLEGADDRLLAGLPVLLRDLAAAGVAELEVSVGDARLYVRQRIGARSVVNGRRAAAGEAAAEEEPGLVGVVTPLAGAFYAAPSPDEPPYVREGDEVEAGQVVGLVEAMKVFNELHVEVAGTVVQVLAKTGDMVQAGQVVVKVRPHAGADEPAGDTPQV
jgi:acetyl-CoA carboxylase biotin carboxyl carrier protein